MNLGDQLDELRGGILRDRSDLIAGESDSLWTDEALLRYIRDGERRFCRETAILRDGTTPKFTRVTMRQGVRDYVLPREVFAVVSARVSGQDYDLKRTGHSLVQSRQLDRTLAWDPTQASTIQPGAPLGFYTDETTVFASHQATTLSVFPVPDATAAGTILLLRVARVPCTGYAKSDLARESEVPDDYQLDVLEWAAYRAKRNNDADIGATPNADAHKDAFEAAIARAKRSLRAQAHVPTGLRYGSNGFSWSR